MKILNIMNFVRQCDPRIEDSENLLFDATRRELELVNEFGYKNTFLLQYDALIDPRYQRLFIENMSARMELGLWLEIVEPLVKSVGLPWRGRKGWKWDWYVVPGFSMAYTPDERRLLIDECMRKFMEVFGFYPRSVCSWLIDSVTAEYLCDSYGIEFLGICRDQVNTDAYTLIGGYFNQAYYPSRLNIFTPAQSREMQLSAPVFRLLGPDPIHNYEGARYLYDQKTNYIAAPGERWGSVFTMEAVWLSGKNEAVFRWLMDAHFKSESLGFAYAQIGQENSFGYTDFIPALRRQLELLSQYPEVQVMTLREAGQAFKSLYSLTPATAVTALKDWNRGIDVGTVCYDCKNYCASLLRVENRLFLRYMYLFDERIPEKYLHQPAANWDATYENPPIIDTLRGDARGFELDTQADPFELKRDGERLVVSWARGSLIFAPDEIRVNAPEPVFYANGHPAKIRLENGSLCFSYLRARYALVCPQLFEEQEGAYCVKSAEFSLIPRRM